MYPLSFYSTNKKSPKVSLSEALLQGQAPDKGLYLPETLPAITMEWLKDLQNKPYSYIASKVLSLFSEGTFSVETIISLCEDAYNYPIPLEKVDDAHFIMRLDQGPTASFKDFAARMMARMFGELLKNQQRELVILTATSGDTGSAVANAFYKIPHIRVMVLFPPDEVSNRQRKQMTTLGENISIVGIDGKFDDCQALVKQAFADDSLGTIDLTSANSINIGRLLPQMVYYVYAYVNLVDIGEPLNIAIPSGNFGNMMGAILTKHIGVPINKLIIATNANDEVPVYFDSAEYMKIVPSRNCISNAMNVGHPSNLARLIALYGGWMDETGQIHQQPDLDKMKQDIWPISISDEETRETIKKAWKKHQLLLEPHGAVGWAGMQKYQESIGEMDITTVSVETAHPAKFPEEIESLLGFSPDVPDSLLAVESKSESFMNLKNDYPAFHQLLIETCGT